MSYATPADLVARVDAQIIGDLITDDDEQTGLRDRPPLTDILASSIVQTALDDASGDVLAALGKGKRYTPDQLTALTGPGLSKLKRIVCDIAISYLFDRRADAKNEERAESYRTKAERHLKALKSGEDIFYLGDETDADAGIIATDGPTSLDLTNINRLDERMSSRHLISSSERLPRDRG
jgi:phage gp36-like protein